MLLHDLQKLVDLKNCSEPPHLAGLALLKFDVHFRTDEHGDLKVQADLVINSFLAVLLISNSVSCSGDRPDLNSYLLQWLPHHYVSFHAPMGHQLI